MTVLIAVNTRDAIVLAADSQGTVTRPLVDPKDLSHFFDMGNGKKLRTDPEGKPLLDTWSLIESHAKDLPYKIHYNVEKIFSLEPLKMGVMVSGMASIGDRTIKSLLSQFKASTLQATLNGDENTLKDTANMLLDFLYPYYEEIYPNGNGPEIEMMLCGYEKSRYTAGVTRIYVQGKRVSEPDFEFCIFFGGITREIQRLLFGIDSTNKARLMKRSQKLLNTYREYLSQFLHSNNIDIELPKPELYGGELSLFHNLALDSLQMNCATYPEQDAIECAEFLVNVMINSQRFSNQIPTTGGTVQLAIIRKQSGFRYINQS